MKQLIVFLYFVIDLQCRQLQMIQQTFRHGARYPVFLQKADSSDSAQIVNNIGELTTQGKNMHYVLGKIIYQKYWKQLLKDTSVYNQSYFYVKSTDKNRTIQSAQSHMYGLLENLPKLQLSQKDYLFSLPPWATFQAQKNISQSWEVYESSYHPVPVHVQKRMASICDDGDFLTKYDIQQCPNQKFWTSQNFETDQNNEIMRDPMIKQTLNALQQAIGQQVDFQNVYRWKDTYTCLKYLGLPYHPIFQDPKYSKIIDFIQTYTTYLTYYAQVPQIRAVSSNYLKNTLQNIQNKIKGVFTPKFVIYSGHDTTLMMIFAAMNFTNVQCIVDHYLNGIQNQQTCIYKYPIYASNFIIELWNNNGQYSIRMLYNGQIRKIPICDYKTQCTVTQFRNWVNSFAIKDVNAACGYIGRTKTFYAVIFLFVSIIIILVFYICYLHARIKKIDSVGRAKKQGYIQNFEQKNHEQLKI